MTLFLHQLIFGCTHELDGQGTYIGFPACHIGESIQVIEIDRAG
jgi:hypothetical protein